MSGWSESYPEPSKSAIFQARTRLGSRTQDPPTRSPRRVALEIPRPGAVGDLGASVLSLRDPDSDDRYRAASRPRSRPVSSEKALRVVRRSVTQGASLLSSLNARTRSGIVGSPGTPAISTREGDHEQTQASRHAKSSNGPPHCDEPARVVRVRRMRAKERHVAGRRRQAKPDSLLHIAAPGEQVTEEHEHHGVSGKHDSGDPPGERIANNRACAHQSEWCVHERVRGGAGKEPHHV